ncbi:hypothetical protein J3458_018941 [Metarhizium acridum]|uniref:uncharacterized protein n=1 Tax=Metarhizium acridum TaxID=92637 RepID=UPI001C6B1567|nr:hypothetical protein J3458_018941 [Metarhizium acridum]
MGLVAAAHKGRRLILHPHGGVHRPFHLRQTPGTAATSNIIYYYLVPTADGGCVGPTLTAMLSKHHQTLRKWTITGVALEDQQGTKTTHCRSTCTEISAMSQVHGPFVDMHLANGMS